MKMIIVFSKTAALNHQNIRNHPEKISNVKHFINQSNWEGVDFQLHPKTVKKKVRSQKILC